MCEWGREEKKRAETFVQFHEGEWIKAVMFELEAVTDRLRF